MMNNMATGEYSREVTPIERLFTRSPFSVVTVVARIKGSVSEEMLRNAVSKVQERHLHLRVRIIEDDKHTPWFTTGGVGEIPVEVVARETDDQWIKVQEEAGKIPFEFDAGPLIRFVLVHSPSISEVVIVCHHIICDGMSLAYLARDLMIHLGDARREVEILPNPMPVSVDNLPEEVSMNGIFRYFINRMNKKWQEDKIDFDNEDYKSLSQAYWSHYTHKIIPIEFSEAQTAALVKRCREEEVTVNSALAMAFVGAQHLVQGEKPYHAKIGVAGDLRKRLTPSVGEGMGFYAGVVQLDHNYAGGKSLWENARRFHKKVTPLYTNKKLFNDALTWCYLDPTILEAINFKKLGGLVPVDLPGHDKLVAFSQQDDVVLSVLKRDKMESLDRVMMGTAVTNLTRLDFPREYGELELDRLILQPGGAFPLVNVNLVLGAVTCSGKLSLVMEYAEEAVDTATMQQIRDKAMELLLKDPKS